VLLSSWLYHLSGYKLFDGTCFFHLQVRVYARGRNPASRISGVKLLFQQSPIVIKTSPCFTPIHFIHFYCNNFYQFRTLLNLRSIICSLTPFGWLRSFTLSPYFWWEYCVLFTPTFSGGQLGRKTRAGCMCYVKKLKTNPCYRRNTSRDLLQHNYRLWLLTKTEDSGGRIRETWQERCYVRRKLSLAVRWSFNGKSLKAKRQSTGPQWLRIYCTQQTVCILLKWRRFSDIAVLTHE
jgi:hypothetical protein